MRDTEAKILKDVREMFHEVMENPRYGIHYGIWEKGAEMNMQPRASLDHFVGRVVTGVSQNEDGQWGITLDGGIVITNKDDARQLDADVVGKALVFVSLSELETRLQFGVQLETGGVVNDTWVDLTPTGYTLSGLEGQTEEFYPQMPEELADMLPPDPSAERIVDGSQESTGEAQSDGEE